MLARGGKRTGEGYVLVCREFKCEAFVVRAEANCVFVLGKGDPITEAPSWRISCAPPVVRGVGLRVEVTSV